ncbi:MAG: hypothetical protein RL007_2069 [Bacteroidota bacterium]|jgi:hypothetical protein
MLTREHFHSTYITKSEDALSSLVKEQDKLTAEARAALQDVLRERNLMHLIPQEKPSQVKTASLAHLSADEIRAIINRRLDSGEKLESIKVDLQSRGVDLLKVIAEEGEKTEAIDERLIELQSQGKTEEEIAHQLKKEFGISKEEAAQLPEQVKSRGAGLIAAGVLMLVIGIPYAAVMLQSAEHMNTYFLALIPAGLGLVIAGWRRKRVK